MAISSYASKSTAIRGLERAGISKDRWQEFIKQVEGGRWEFDTDAVDKALGLAGVSEEDENLILGYGHSHCPQCGIHLSNGVGDYDGLVDIHGEKQAYAYQQHEWRCMACEHEWGDPIDPPKGAKGRKEPTRHYVNRSTVEGAVAQSHALFDEHPDLRRKDAIALAVENGITFYTARTQYQKWFKARKSAQSAK